MWLYKGSSSKYLGSLHVLFEWPLNQLNVKLFTLRNILGSSRFLSHIWLMNTFYIIVLPTYANVLRSLSEATCLSSGKRNDYIVLWMWTSSHLCYHWLNSKFYSICIMYGFHKKCVTQKQAEIPEISESRLYIARSRPFSYNQINQNI